MRTPLFVLAAALALPHCTAQERAALAPVASAAAPLCDAFKAITGPAGEVLYIACAALDAVAVGALSTAAASTPPAAAPTRRAANAEPPTCSLPLTRAGKVMA